MRIIKIEKNCCMPCKKLDSILNNLGVEVEHKNIDEEDCTEIIEKYGIMSTPVLVKILDDNSFKTLAGINYTMNEFKSFLEIDEYQVDKAVGVGCENGNCSL